MPPEMQSRALDYLRQIEDHYPSWYDKRTRQTLSAYALYVRDLMGDGDVAKARRLLDEAGLEDLSLEAVAWLWQVLDDDPGSAAEVEAIRRHIGNRAVETAGAANFTTSYGDQAYLLLHSDRRTDAIILDAMIAGDPESDLIPKVVNGLLAHRTEGRWDNTQENVFVLLALDRYFNTFEAQTPDFVARIWLGDTYVGEHAYQGRTTERHETAIPMAYLAASDEAQDLILGKEGPGRLYYRLGLRYAPTDLALDPLDMGFVVQRSYEAVDDPEDVVQDEDWRLAYQGRGARARAADDGGRQPALPRGSGRPAAGRAGDRQSGSGRLWGSAPGSQRPGLPLWLVVVGHLVRAPEHARRAGRSLCLAAVGRRLRLLVRGPGHHAGDVRGATGQGGGDVFARGLWPQQQRLGDRGVSTNAPRRQGSRGGHEPPQGFRDRARPGLVPPAGEEGTAGAFFEYVAFYFTAAFAEHKWAIHYYARRLGHELVTRRELLPDEPDHPHAGERYYKLQLGPLQRREPPIVSLRWRRITFIHTTWDRFRGSRGDQRPVRRGGRVRGPAVPCPARGGHGSGAAVPGAGVGRRVSWLDLAVPCQDGVVSVSVAEGGAGPGASLRFSPEAVRGTSKAAWLRSASK